MSGSSLTDALRAAERDAERLQELVGSQHRVLVVLGSGWDGAAAALGDLVASVPYSSLAGFPPPSVAGHAGMIESRRAADRSVLVFRGRVHLSEGYDATEVVHGVRSAVLAGCEVIVLTNAAGTLDPTLPVGSLVLLRDHINLTGQSPLRGSDPPAPYRSRFFDMSDAYSRRLRALVRQLRPSVPEAVYAGLHPGGGYETPAEIRMLRTLGADLLGGSTILETVAAVHLGAEVLGVSLASNLAAGLGKGPLSHDDVLEAGRQAAPAMGSMVRAFIDSLPPQHS
jgi:purine-nucleoside phosphorylase